MIAPAACKAKELERNHRGQVLTDSVDFHVILVRTKYLYIITL